MEKNLLLIALPRAAMCMQFPAQGVERGAPMFCTETKSSWLLGSGSCSIPRHLFCRVPTPHPKLLTPGSQPQRAAPRNAQCANPNVPTPRCCSWCSLCAWAPCQAEPLPRVEGVWGGPWLGHSSVSEAFSQEFVTTYQNGFLVFFSPLTATRAERGARAQRGDGGRALLRVP